MKALAVILTLFASVLNARTSGSKPFVSDLTTFSTQVIPLVIVGDGWTERFVMQNTDSTFPSAGSIRFFTQTGVPMSMNLKGYSPASSFTFSIPLGKTIEFDTVAASGSQRLGWAFIENSLTGIGTFYGQMIFRKQSPGLPDFMCSMPFGGLAFAKVSTFFDNTNGNYTGIGVLTSLNCGVFSCAGSVPLSVTVRNISGAVVSTKIINQQQGTLYWMNLGTDFPETNGIMGTFEVSVVNAYSTTLTGVSLQFAANGAFTVITPFEQ